MQKLILRKLVAIVLIVSMIFTMGVLLIIILLLGIFPDVVTNGISNFVGGIL